jgi:hypothetical protein
MRSRWTLVFGLALSASAGVVTARNARGESIESFEVTAHIDGAVGSSC